MFQPKNTERTLPKKFNCIELKTLCKDREDYLLNPNKGRKLTEDSLSILDREGTKDTDVQIIIGDGLSAWAIEKNVPELLPCLIKEFSESGFSLGKIIFK